MLSITIHERVTDPRHLAFVQLVETKLLRQLELVTALKFTQTN